MSGAFAAELARWGPHCDYPAPSPAAARTYCRRLATRHYENFSVASLFVPRHLLRHFHNIYAYCRWADDLSDETAGGDTALALLAWWQRELLGCYHGSPRHPVMIALHETIEKFDIPPKPFLDLITAFEQDQRIKSYDTYDQLLGYCQNSANPVGRLVLYLGRCHDETRGELSDHICTALQLTNFWQDVARDFDIERVYLPREDRDRFGFSDDDLQARRCMPAFRELMRLEVDRTRAMFHEGMPLVGLMPKNLRAQIELFARGGLAILHKIERQGYDVFTRRPKLAKWEKGLLVVRTLGGCLGRSLRHPSLAVSSRVSRTPPQAPHNVTTPQHQPEISSSVRVTA
ncbi:MAG: squalene synthase HpnC [Gemmataceae bacterium]